MRVQTRPKPTLSKPLSQILRPPAPPPPPLDETAFQRARRDAKTWSLGTVVGLLVTTATGTIGAKWGPSLLDANAASGLKDLALVGGAVIGAGIGVAVFLIAHWLLAPRKQRDELRRWVRDRPTKVIRIPFSKQLDKRIRNAVILERELRDPPKQPEPIAGAGSRLDRVVSLFTDAFGLVYAQEPAYAYELEQRFRAAAVAAVEHDTEAFQAEQKAAADEGREPNPVPNTFEQRLAAGVVEALSDIRRGRAR